MSTNIRNFVFDKRLINLCLFFVLIFIACSIKPTPEKIVTEYAKILSSHNVDSLMAQYSDDIIFNIPKMSMYLEGKEALRGVAEYDSVLGTIMTISNVINLGDTVRCDIVEKNKWLKIAGIDSAYYPKSDFVITDGKIKYIHADLSDTTAQLIGAVMASFMPWLGENYPHYVNLLMPDDKFIFNAEHGELILMLLTQWSTTRDI